MDDEETPQERVARLAAKHAGTHAPRLRGSRTRPDAAVMERMAKAGATDLVDAVTTITRLEDELRTVRADNARLHAELAKARRMHRNDDPATSAAAAQAHIDSGDRDTRLGRLLHAYMSDEARTHGLTAHEACVAADVPEGAWRRVSELRNSGWIVDAGETRLNPVTGMPQQVDILPLERFQQLEAWGWTQQVENVP